MSMNKDYYVQSATNPKTLTVGELIAKLHQLDPMLPIVFESPEYGAYGSGCQYTLDSVTVQTLPREEKEIPGGMTEDDETGEPVPYEGWTEIKHAWHGVVLK